MSETQFDAIIIGGGQAGPSLASRLSAAGMSVAIAERKFWGGTCVNTGCTPTKAMVASAYAAHMTRRAADFGVTVGGSVGVDLPAVMARKDAILMKSRTGLEQMLHGLDRCTVLEEHARFESPHVVRVGEQLLRAEKIFLNVGGRARIPDLPGVHDVPVLTNVSLLELKDLPRHLIIVGGSYIGIEFGQMFRRFGSEVTLLEKGPRLVGNEDEDVSKAVEDILRKEGIDVRTGAECIHFAKRATEIVAGVSCETGEPEVVGSHVLLGVGRRPNTDDLGLERAGIAVDEKGYILVDDQLRTNVSGVWAMGDCNGRGAFTHTSYNDYEVVAANLLEIAKGDVPRRVSDRITAYAMYMDPPLGRAGMTEAEVRKSGRPALMATRPMTKVARALEKGESEGFMKVLVDAETQKILGASILGTGGDEAIHTLLDVMYTGAPYTVMQRAMHIHPTVSELIPTMLGDLKPLK